MKILLTGNTAFKLANFRAGLIRALIADGHELVAVVPPDDYTADLITMGCEVIDLEMSRKGSAIFEELALLRRFHAIFRAQRPDAIFSYTIKNNIYGALAARWLKIPFVPNVTGLGTAFESRGLLNRAVVTLYRVAFRKLTIVYFQNTHDRDLFRAARIVSDDQMGLLPGSGVDLDAFTASPLPSADDAPVFLLVARMLKDKGIEEFVEAAKHVAKDHPHARFQLLGPLDTESRVGIARPVIDAWVAQSPVEYLGEVKDVRPVVAMADCIVLPSYYKEGTPRALLEAAAMGRPIVTTDMPGCRDTVDPGTTGLLCPPRDIGQLAQAMDQIVRMGAAGRQTFGHAARLKCETQFSEEVIITQYRQVLAAL